MLAVRIDPDQLAAAGIGVCAATGRPTSRVRTEVATDTPGIARWLSLLFFTFSHRTAVVRLPIDPAVSRNLQLSKLVTAMGVLLVILALAFVRQVHPMVLLLLGLGAIIGSHVWRRREWVQVLPQSDGTVLVIGCSPEFMGEVQRRGLGGVLTI